MPAYPTFLNTLLERHKIIESILVRFPFLKPQSDFPLDQIPGRTAVFIREGRKRGFEFTAYKGPLGFVNYFEMKIGDRSFLFGGLPRAEFLSGKKYQFIDDKAKVRKILKKRGFPVAQGQSFWFFQKTKAKRFAQKLDFPLVVKPRTGSLSNKVFTDIENSSQLNFSINQILSYFPSFLIEEFLDLSDYRITVVDFKKIFCFKRRPASVVGDGEHTVKDLVQIKNSHPQRGPARNVKTPFHNIVVNQDTEDLLKEQGLSLSSVPQKGKRVFLQKDPFLKLGGDPVDKTSEVHPDNIQLFKNIAGLFDAHLVGIDFLAQDISKSWKDQDCAILELNSLPGIIGHHFPFQGKPQNVAGALVDMVMKYYL